MNKSGKYLAGFFLGWLAACAWGQQWQWAHNSGGFSDANCWSVARDPSGDAIYVTGSFVGRADFGGITLVSRGGADVFIAKYYESGELVWVRQAGGKGYDTGKGAAVDAQGNVYITGYFSTNANFGTLTLTNRGDTDMFIAKFDANGFVKWAQSAGGPLSDTGNGLAVDPDSNVYVTGFFRGTARFGATDVTSYGEADEFLVKYDSNGGLVWLRHAGSENDDDAGNSVAVDPSGKLVYVTGYYKGFAEFGGVTLSSGVNTAIYLAQYSASGQPNWVIDAGGYNWNFNSVGSAVAVDEAGGVFLTGYFDSYAVFSDAAHTVPLSSHGFKDSDIFLAKYNERADLLWARALGGSNFDEGRGLATDSGGNVYVTGYFRGRGDFGNGNFLTSRGGPDVFVARYDTDGIPAWQFAGGGVDNDTGNGIGVDNFGGIYVTGQYVGEAYFGNHQLLGSSFGDFFLAKIFTDLKPPVIVRQPQSLVVNSGTNVLFQVVASGREPLFYQWNKDGTNLEGATNATLSLANVQVGDGGTYQVTVRNVDGIAVSDPADLTVNVLIELQIVEQPRSQIVPAGTNVTFKVSVVGSPPITYQWFKDNQELPGETADTLSLFNVHLLEAGAYRVVVSNPIGTQNSAPANLSVVTPPQIVTQPKSQRVRDGTDVVFTVVVESNGPLTYQWFFNGQPVPGAVTDRLEIKNVQTDNMGNYTVTAVNIAGSVTSDPALLSVFGRPIIVEQPRSQTVLAGTDVAFSVRIESEDPVDYQWEKNGVAIDGALLNRLVLTSVQEIDQGRYRVRISNRAGPVLSEPATLTVLTPPQITGFVENQTALPGTDVYLWVLASGDPDLPLSFQWRREGVPIPNETSDVLVLRGVQESNQATYTVVVTNSVGSITSAPVTLTLAFPLEIVEQPQNQTVIEGALATFQVVVSGRPVYYQWEDGGGAMPGATNATLAFSNVTASVAGTYSVRVFNDISSLQSQPATLEVITKPRLVESPRSLTVAAGTNALFRVLATSTGELNYRWQKDGRTVEGAIYSLLLLEAVQNRDAGNYRAIVYNAAGSVTSAVATLTVLTAPAILTQPVSQTTTNGGEAAFQVVATGDPTPEYRWFLNGQLLPNATAPTLALTNVQGAQVGDYWVIVSNVVGAVTSATAKLSLRSAPVILTQPSNQVVFQGSNAVFQVVATGNPSPSYAWYHDENALPGQTNATLLLAAVKPADAGSFRVVVTNVVGAVTSTVASLTVLVPPQITRQPESLTTVSGDKATFQVTATGVPAPGYQWFFNGQVLPNAVQPTLTLPSVQGANAGDYWVVVSNTAGSVTSATARLSLQIPPTILVQPANQVAVQGSNATFQVVATGDPAPAYVWYREENILSGQTQATLLLSAVKPADAGSFRVVVTNVVGAVTSTVASLTVLVPPQITRQPESHNTTNGATVVFAVEATGTEPLGYQWQFNGHDLPGQTQTSVILSNVQSTQAGNYTVVVSNPAGSVTSQPASLVLPSLATLIGQVTDAINGLPLGGVTVTVGDRSTTTGANGTYVLPGLAPGVLTADFDANIHQGEAPLTVRFVNLSLEAAITVQGDLAGYLSYTNSRVSLPAGETAVLNFSLSPVISGPGQMRLVLNWGTAPKDLDIHLATPTIEGVNYHVFYALGFRGDTNRPPYCQLDVDKQDGFGPETITITRFFPGIYHCYVNKFDEFGFTGDLTKSKAVVQFYTDEGLVRTLSVPTTGQGDYWDVCDIDGLTGAITLINQITDQPPFASAIAQSMSQSSTPLSATGSTSPGLSYYWDFGDGTTSSEENPTKTYTNPGVFTVSLQATTDDHRTDTETKTQYIAVANDLPALRVSLQAEHVVVQWQRSDPDFVLEYKRNLGQEDWQSVTQSPALTGDIHTVILPVQGTGQFFRLRKR